MQTSVSSAKELAQKPDKNEAAGIAKREDQRSCKAARYDPEAMKTLYDHHSVAVFRFLHRLLQDSALAESLTGEVFLEVWRRSKKEQDCSPVSDRLLAIAYNKAFAELARRCSKGGRNSLREVTTRTCADHGLTRPAGARENQSRSASLRQRAIADLVYYHKKSLDEVATILGVPREAVRIPGPT